MNYILKDTEKGLYICETNGTPIRMATKQDINALIKRYCDIISKRFNNIMQAK